MGVFPAALGGYICDATFDYLQQLLLHSLTGNVPGDGTVQALFAGDLVQFIDVDDAVLGTVHIPISRLDQPEEDILHILADVSGLGERSGVAYGEWDVQSAGQGFGQEGFAAAGGADEQDIGLLEFDIRTGALMSVPDALEVIVDRDAENLFRLNLAHYIGVQVGVDLPRRQRFGWFEFLGRWRILFFHHLTQHADAVVADRCFAFPGDHQLRPGLGLLTE